MPDHVLPTHLTAAPSEYQPVETRFGLADGIAVVSNLFVRAGAFLPQHTHEYAHSSVVAFGRVKMWQDSKYLGEFGAGSVVEIPAHSRHIHQAQVDGTVVLCIHNVSRTGEIDMVDENQIV